MTTWTVRWSARSERYLARSGDDMRHLGASDHAAEEWAQSMASSYGTRVALYYRDGTMVQYDRDRGYGALSA